MSGVIAAKGLGHQFGEKVVLKDVKLEVGQGEIFGLLGPSGAGKTTLINILTGQLSPKDGESSLLGVDSRKLTGADYEKIGIMMDSFGLYEAEKLCDNIALLNKGKIVEYGSPSDICRRYYHQKRIKIRLKSGEDVELAYTKESGRQIEEYFEKDEMETIHSMEPDLETVFMELTGEAFDRKAE